jgi:hypothetical protein
MNPYETHGAFSWSELMASDPKATGDFYGKLFGWKIETSDMGSGRIDPPPKRLRRSPSREHRQRPGKASSAAVA